jgi:spore germination cell wall hydrolase CwlJ-like protein
MNAERFVAAPSRARLKWAIPVGLTVIAILLIGAGLMANVNHRDDLTRARQIARQQTTQPQSQVAPLNLVRPLSPEEAVKANEERPFSATPDTPAKQFKLRADETSRDRALECLTQAVYYEAATESADGQRAVAQVVLNRMRHPGFPSSVCGVVYQGAELPTGCQFTFTCDGSLARTPIASVWARAHKIALEALAGHVFAPVGHATHYHADYVLPYWADSLAKQIQIGHHIFYRLKGGLGTDPAFSQRYAGKEPDLPPPPSSVAVAADATGQAQALIDSGLAGDSPPPLAADAAGLAGADKPKDVLLADATKPTLLIDKGIAAPANAPKKRASENCDEANSKRVLPTAPNDFRAGSAASGC